MLAGSLHDLARIIEKLENVTYAWIFTLKIYLLDARRTTYVFDGRFFAHCFWKVEGTVCTHVNSHVAPIHSN